MPISERHRASVVHACIFDLDGVLVDTMEAHFCAWRAVAAELKVNLTDEELQDFRGRPRTECLDIILRKTSGTTPAKYARLLESKGQLYRTNLQEMGHAVLVPGIPLLLRGLRQRGYRIGLASASRSAQAIMELAGIVGDFDAISDGHFTGAAKPAPDQLIDLARRLRCATSAMVVFDDAPAGILATRAACAYSIGIGPAVEGHPHIDAWLPSLAQIESSEIERVLNSITHAGSAGRSSRVT